MLAVVEERLFRTLLAPAVLVVAVTAVNMLIAQQPQMARQIEVVVAVVVTIRLLQAVPASSSSSTKHQPTVFLVLLLRVNGLAQQV